MGALIFIFKTFPFVIFEEKAINCQINNIPVAYLICFFFSSDGPRYESMFIQTYRIKIPAFDVIIFKSSVWIYLATTGDVDMLLVSHGCNIITMLCHLDQLSQMVLIMLMSVLL